MSSIITGVLNSTIGLLCKKIRDSTAAKLQHGDVTDAKIRGIVIRELNDIKTKVDGLSRKDLLSSYSFLREGVELLNVSLDQSTQEDRRESSAMPNDIALAILSEVSEALTRAVGKVKSCTEFELAKERFKDARKKATEAFCNEALGIDDRIFAAKLRVVSEILENLESPKAAITGCLSFLRDLHTLPAIREIFSVYLNGGVKSLLGKEERAANVKSIMLINYVLYQFTFKFSKSTDRLNWPAGTIKLGDRTFNPVLEWQKVSSRKSMGGELDERPNEQLVFGEEIYPRSSVVNSRGEIVVRHSRDEIKIIFRTGETKVVKFPKLEAEGEFIGHSICAIAVGKDNDIHVVIGLKTLTENDVVTSYMLNVLDDSYNVKHAYTLDFLEKKSKPFGTVVNNKDVDIAINENNDVIMIRYRDPSVYVFDNSGKLKYKFKRNSGMVRELSISNKNEIMISYDKTVNLYTEEGTPTSTIKLPEGHMVYGMAFHYVLGKKIVLTCLCEEVSCFLLCYSEAGELESSTFLCDDTGFSSLSITSHPGGPVAVVRKKSITFI